MGQAVQGSPYMQWAKRVAHVRYNLAASGVASCSLADLGARLEDIHLTGDTFYGYQPLVGAIGHRYGIPPEKVFTSIGTSLANHLAMAVLLSPGDEVLIEQPTYEPLISTALYLGATVKRFRRIPEGGFRILPEEVSGVISPSTKLVVLTNLHNPTSVFTGEEDLLELSRVVRSASTARILVDEVYLDSAFTRKARPAALLGEEFISTNSLTKVYGMSGVRCGWALAPPELVRKMWHLNDLFEVNPPHPAECLAVAAFRQIEHLTDRARRYLNANSQVFRSFLSSRRKDLEWVAEAEGLMAFVRLRGGSVDELCELLLARYETSVTPGKFFEMPEYFRVGLGNEPCVFSEGIRRLSLALDELSL